MKLNSIIIADDSDSCDISDLCVKLKDSTLQLIEEYMSSLQPSIELQNKVYMSDAITKQSVGEIMASINDQSFMCFLYGHGTNESFNIGDESVITTTDNYYVFSNALIYTFSCLNGNDLADALINNKAKAFVGYTGKAHCPYGIDGITTRIAMSFISSFLCGKTVSMAVTDLKQTYSNAIYDESLEPFHRSCFQENRDTLVIKGDKSLQINHLILND